MDTEVRQKAKNDFEKDFFKENFRFWKNHGKCQKTQR